MAALISYDISRRHAELKKALKEIKYLDYWTDNRITYYLPNTTLWKSDVNQNDALNEMRAIIARLNQGQPQSNQIELERCVCVPSAPWAAIPEKEHKA